MNYLLPTVSVLIYTCLEISSLTPERAENELEKREVTHSRYIPPEILEHLEKAVKRKNYREEKNLELPFGVGSERICQSLQNPAYAKATCTSYPGRVVCQLGRYTFVINNGEHKMDPEVIERFAAMIYHRSQEGDSSFDVSVDIPVNVNEDYFGAPQKAHVELTTSVPENLRTPVFIECSPITDDRKMFNPPYSPTEVIYSCKRRELGAGGLGGIEKQMVITVDEEGIVSAGDLVLPYSALLDRRFKRQRDKQPGRAALGGFDAEHWTTPLLDNKVYTDVCSYRQTGWCPNDPWSRCPDEGCVNVTSKGNTKSNNNNVGTAAPSQRESQNAKAKPNQPLSKNLDMGAPQPVAPGGRAKDTVVTVVQDARIGQDQGFIAVDQIKEEAHFATTPNPVPLVRGYSDTCEKITIYPWCPYSFGTADCTVPGCVTLPECSTSGYSGNKGKRRRRREQPHGKKPPCPLTRNRLNRIRSSRRFGQKRTYAKKRRRQVSSKCTTCPTPQISCVLSCKPDTPQCCQQTQSITECTSLSIDLRKREVMRKRKKTNNMQWPNASRERYILE